MKKLLIIYLLGITSLVFAANNSETEESSNKLNVMTSIIPQSYLVERVGGDRVETKVLVGPGKNPATYQPTPKQVIDLSSADVLFTIGVPFEKAYLHKVIDTLENLIVVDLSEGITKRYLEAHSHDDDDNAHASDDDYDDDHDNAHASDDDHDDHDDHDNAHASDDDEHRSEPDPHVWLSPVNAKVMVDNIVETLISLDPDGAEYYKTNAEAVKEELNAVYNEVKTILQPVSGKKILVYHPAFGYFTDEFELEQIAIETGGKEPTPQQIEHIIEEAQELSIQIIVVQPEFSKESAKIIADAIGGRVTVLQPLTEDYMSNLIFIAEEIAKAYSK